MNNLQIVPVMAAVLLFTSGLAYAQKNPHFVFNPAPGAKHVVEWLERDAESKRRYVLGVLGIDDPRVIEVAIASDDESMSEMVGTSRPIKGWVAGIAMSHMDKIVMSARGNEVFKVRDTFVHELAHIYLDSALEGRQVPRWFHEGFAMLVADESVADRLRSSMDASLTKSFIPLAEITNGFPSSGAQVHLAYSQSMLFFRYLNRVSSGEGIANTIKFLRNGEPFEAAFHRAFGVYPEEAFEDFKSSFSRIDSLIVVLTSAAAIWLAITLLFLFVYRRKKLRAKLKQEMWALQDQMTTGWAPTETTGDQALAIDAFKGWRGSESQAAATDEESLEDKMFIVPGPKEIQ